MEATKKTVITVSNTVNAPVKKVWEFWNNPEHITKWNQPSEDWHSPSASNDLKVGGKLMARMEAKDGSMGFDFWGIYDEIRTNEYIAYTLGDDRKVNVTFAEKDGRTEVTETFEAENTHPEEMQRGGWQAILDSFKAYTEKN